MKKLQIILICLFALSAINTNAQTQGAGNALSFDGVNNYVELSNTVGNTSSYTRECWVKFQELSGIRALVSNYYYNAASVYDGVEWRFVNSSGLQVAHLNNGVWGLAEQHVYNWTPTLNEWYYLSVTYDGNVSNMYINGNFISSKNLPKPSFTLNTVLRIGKRHHFGIFFKGQIDEVRIWNRALTQTEIRNNMNKQLTGNEPGLVAYYRMNEGADGTCPGGKDVCDKSGNGNHGTKH